MKLLVLTSEPISADQLRDAVGVQVQPQDAEVMVVAPALQPNPIKFWLSDADDAIARAKEVGAETVEKLEQDGVAATGDTGESDPIEAIQDALASFDADRIVLFTRPGDQQGYREDVDAELLSERFGIPVDRAGLSA
jgi:nucleotide-binding universal stress UspA family protein